MGSGGGSLRFGLFGALVSASLFSEGFSTPVEMMFSPVAAFNVLCGVVTPRRVKRKSDIMCGIR